MNRKFDRLIPLALEAAKLYLSKDGNTIPSEYNGYIASFGAAVVQAGLKPAVAFNERKSESAEDKRPLMKAILHILKKQKGEVFERIENEKLLLYILDNKSNKEQLKRQIIDAATALKLAVRTFKLEKKGERHDS